MDGADALANGFAMPGPEPSSGGGRTLSRHLPGGRPTTHGSATAGTGGSSGPVRGGPSSLPSVLPHIGKFLVVCRN